MSTLSLPPTTPLSPRGRGLCSLSERRELRRSWVRGPRRKARNAAALMRHLRWRSYERAHLLVRNPSSNYGYARLRLAKPPYPSPARGEGTFLRPVADDALHFQEVVDAPIGVFAAVAGLLVAAEGREGVPGGVVDLHLASAQLPRHLPRVLDVLRLDVRRQPIDGVVGDLDRLLLAVVWHDRQHRAEDLLARDGHAGHDVAEHRRAHIVAAVEPFRPAGAA